MDTNIFEFKQTNITNNDEQPEVENINYDKHTSPNPNYKNRSLQKDIENKQNTDEPAQNSIDCTLQANDNILRNESNELNAEEVHTNPNLVFDERNSYLSGHSCVIGVLLHLEHQSTFC